MVEIQYGGIRLAAVDARMFIEITVDPSQDIHASLVPVSNETSSIRHSSKVPSARIFALAGQTSVLTRAPLS
jgi:hypothetical protein